MAKRQTRRSISVKGASYQRIKNYCDDPAHGNGRSISGYLEELIAEKMDEAGVPIPMQPLRAYPMPETRVSAADLEAQPSAHFTF